MKKESLLLRQSAEKALAKKIYGWAKDNSIDKDGIRCIELIELKYHIQEYLKDLKELSE